MKSLVAALALALGLVACAPASGGAEQAVMDTRNAPGSGVQAAAQPQEGWVEDLVAREFGGLFKVEKRNTTPPYLTGDFDGDGAEDLVVIARVRDGVAGAELHDAGFPLYHPLDTGMARGEYNEEVTADELAESAGTLVQLVVHDFRETSGKRRKAALFAAMDYGTVHLRKHRGPVPAAADAATPAAPPPQLRGEAVVLQERGGGGRLLYWDGERFRLYPYGT